MGYLFNKSGNYMLMWGKASRDAILRTTQKGKNWTSFAMSYDRKHDIDGQMKTQYIEVVIWGDDALYVGHEDIGISKGDQILVGGRLVEDTYYREGEDRSVKKYKVEADLVVDMTSIFQIAQMVVVDGIEPTPTPAPQPRQRQSAPKKPQFTDIEDDDDPFMSDEDLDEELPY